MKGYCHIFLDFESGPMSTSQAPFKAVAAVLTDDRGKVLASLAEGTTPFTALHSRFESFVPSEPAIVVAVFPETKKRALKEACAHFDLQDPFAGLPWLDFSQVAWPLLHSEQITSRSLREVGRHFKIEHDGAGSVTGDCAFLSTTYWEMMKRYRTALAGEETLRELGGETLATVRKFMGF